MAKLESAYKADIVSAFKTRGWYARRVEDQFAVGTLDMILCTPSTGLVLCEVKRVRNGKFSPSGRQYVEIDRIRKAGGKWLMVGVVGINGGEFMGYCGSLSRDGTIRAEDCIAMGTIGQFPLCFEEMMK